MQDWGRIKQALSDLAAAHAEALHYATERRCGDKLIDLLKAVGDRLINLSFVIHAPQITCRQQNGNSRFP